MLSTVVRRAFICAAIVSALAAQGVHLGHNHVICTDREGAREECADLLGRCHCHVHEHDGHPERPAEEQPGFSDERAHLPCRDISVGQDWRGSRPFPISSTAVDALAGPAEMRSEPTERFVPPAISGLSPPGVGSSRPSPLSARRC